MSIPNPHQGDNMTTKKDLESKLKNVSNIIDEYMSKEHPMLVSTQRLLNTLKTAATGVEPETEEETVLNPSEGRIIVSCDASIKKNPGGPSSVGIVIADPAQEKPLGISQVVKATTNNQAEYDAVYVGLMSLVNLNNNPQTVIEVRSDSLLVIDQLNGVKKCNDEKLNHRRELILELIQSLPVPVELVWRPRNSTPDLKLGQPMLLLVNKFYR